MPHAVENIAIDLQQLTARLLDLERRVDALEGHSLQSSPESNEVAAPLTALQRPKPPATWRGFPPVGVQGGAVPTVGKAVLGIAGAYLLRAVAESGTIPKLPVLFVAIVYAAFWMVWAVRSHDSNHFASITYGITSALILSPLLWESTVRFEVISSAFAAVVLVAFVVLTLTLAWRRNLQAIPWVATLATEITALALIIATRDLVPLTAALLTVALATEIAACAGHRLSLRAVPAIAADFAVWLILYVLTSSQGVPEVYRPAGSVALTFLSLALLGIYGGSIGIRSFALRHRITFFEVVQGVVSFLLATWGTLRATHDSGAPELGALFLLLAAVNYWGALFRFADESHARNRRVSATWAAALLLAGCFLLLPASFQIPFLCVAALAAVFLYSRTRKFSLGLHTSFYLAAAAAVSSLPVYVATTFAGAVPNAPGWGLWVVAVCATLCYIIGARVSEDRSTRRLLWVVPAALVGFTAAALVVVAAVSLAAAPMKLAASRLSVIRTMVNCLLALALGFAGSRWKRVELGWVAYAALSLGTLKLVLEDLRFGNAASLVVSLIFYGLVLILLPRLTRY
jgi:hypothetical protein